MENEKQKSLDKQEEREEYDGPQSKNKARKSKAKKKEQSRNLDTSHTPQACFGHPHVLDYGFVGPNMATMPQGTLLYQHNLHASGI